MPHIKKYVKAAVAYLQSAVNVYPINGILYLNGYTTFQGCGYDQIQYPQDHIDNGVPNTDLLIYILGNETDFYYLAYSQFCNQGDINTDTGRQTVGYLKMNLAAFQKDFSEGFGIRWITTIIHEIIHIMAFNPYYYYSFRKPTGELYYGYEVLNFKNNRTFLIVQPLLDYAREHFGCPLAEGIPLEDYGEQSAQCHFERTALGNEGMTASRIGDQVFSNFTLKLLESTGWYLPNYEMAQPFNWGKHEGCDFLTGDCPQYSIEFCVNARKDYVTCSLDYVGLSDCWTQDPFSSECPYWKYIYNAQCKYDKINDYKRIIYNYDGSIGPLGACLQTNIPNNSGQKFEGFALAANCFQVFCQDNSGILTLFILLEKSQQLVNCTESYQQINTESGIIYCPNIIEYCNYPSACINSCSLSGMCKNGKCICYPGFTGIDCSESIQ